MKITAMVSIPDQEAEVYIDGNDVVAAMLGDTEGYRPEQLIRRAFNNIGLFMVKMPDEEVAKLSPEVRKAIADFCEKQGQRFRM